LARVVGFDDAIVSALLIAPAQAGTGGEDGDPNDDAHCDIARRDASANADSECRAE
jgi:hypothetical protein